MKRGLFISVGVLAPYFIAIAEEQKLGIRVDDADQVEINWNGINERIYFIEWSSNLVDWGYMPVISTGSGTPLAFGFESDASKFFVRLKMTDQPVIDPKGADFDLDGLSNWSELTTWTTDPFKKDSDNDGFPDGQNDSDFDGISDQWETMLALQLGDPAINGIADIDETTDSDDDGVDDYLEFQSGLSGHKLDSDGDGYGDRLAVDLEIDFKLDEQNGFIAMDSGPSGHVGFLVDAPVWQPVGGVSRGALQFAGGADAVTFPAETFHVHADLSVSLWFKTDNISPNQALLTSANSSQASEFSIVLEQTSVAGDTIRVDAGAGETFTWVRSRSLADGLWHHVVVVRDATNSNVTLYLDGESEGSTTATSQLMPLNVEAITLGQRHTSVSSYDPAAAYTGSLDELRVYSAVLENKHILELFRPNDLDADLLPDDYEESITGNLSTLVGAEDDLDGDMLNNREEFEAGTDPLDYYNGQTPVVALVTGGGQTIYNGQDTPDPLVFKITSDGSTPLPNAPVTLEHLGLMGSVKTLDGKTLSSSIILTTNSSGEVAVYFKAD